MKKGLFLLTFAILFFLSSNGGVSAAENRASQFPTKSEIEALNQELQELVIEANERLAHGEKNIEVTSENLKLVFNEEDLEVPSTLNKSQLNSLNAAAASKIGSKSYQAYVTNTAGFNFTHAVSGVFSWNGDLLTAVSASADLTGLMYDKSSTTTKEGLDGTIGKNAKVARVTSKGTFKALKFFVTYHTTIVIDIYAPTESYRIIDARINT
ncbi:hypothetical protein RCG24_14615 [Neobacillus sp. OS1-32]|jgi:hypothetical protein|uniref:hypothetical protein n=1 Tax=Neobacillus sp. OS1-32 TaxID=3070682 RepID=UPI0027E08F09|nr:hypothetical protein [Neobacillus sp. OS1-32]WML29217.1 hypothetical protein RCG24_14615 [Neobacillus sp. OS1-32]